jgi:DNA-directed RNA polymerase II subunit RPB11
LIEDQHVVFAGYKVPHPLQYTFHLKVQTDNFNGHYTPEQAVKVALIAMQKQSMTFMEKLNLEVIKARADAARTDVDGR